MPVGQWDATVSSRAMPSQNEPIGKTGRLGEGKERGGEEGEGKERGRWLERGHKKAFEALSPICIKTGALPLFQNEIGTSIPFYIFFEFLK